MKCTFMHKRTPVAELELDDVIGFYTKNWQCLRTGASAYRHPHVRNEIADRAAFNDWWRDRSIPASRSGVREALESLGVADTKMLLVRCYGLSLSDQYWICPEGAELRWGGHQLFSKMISRRTSEMCCSEKERRRTHSISAPRQHVGRQSEKAVEDHRWEAMPDQGRQQSVPAAAVQRGDRLRHHGAARHSSCIVYGHLEQGCPYSVCEDFVTENTELIPAWRLLQAKKAEEQHLPIPASIGVLRAARHREHYAVLDRMLVLDYIIANEDRHFNNFGALRNAETLEWLGMAPIYDSGSSLGYDKMPGQMRSERTWSASPFKNHHAEQLKLVTDFDWIDFDRLSDVDELISSVLSCEEAADYIDEGRIHAITESVQRRIGHLQELAMTQTPRQLEPPRTMSERKLPRLRAENGA